MSKSYRIIASGGAVLEQQIRDNSKGIVKVQTDDLVLPIAHNLGYSTEGYRKFGFAQPADRGRKVEWSIASVDPLRITHIQTLS